MPSITPLARRRPLLPITPDLHVAGRLDAVDWSWIATADVAAVAAWLERVRAGKLWPERED